MKDQLLTVQFNNKISGGVYHMSLAGDCSGIERPGQFIDILIDDYFLRRPISIFDHDDEHVEILYRVVGGGTDALSAKVPGDVLDVLLPLGNGFDTSKIFSCDPAAASGPGKKMPRILLVAGGIGMPPIHELAKQLRSKRLKTYGISSVIKTSSDDRSQPDLTRCDGVADQAQFKVLLGFRSSDDMFGLDSFKSLGIEPVVATEDGSYGIKGLVTDVMDLMKHGTRLDFDYDYVFCCGPEPMLRAVYDHSPDGQFSFEERMGCGFGACMGCSCKTKYGYKRICRDGPVLTRDEIIW